MAEGARASSPAPGLGSPQAELDEHSFRSATGVRLARSVSRAGEFPVRKFFVRLIRGSLGSQLIFKNPLLVFANRGLDG
jgi:hypothetical protein